MQLCTRLRSVRSFLMAVAICGVASAVHAAVPSPWLAQDVGAPSPAGSSSVSSGVFTISASGTDIWNSSDQFHFVYQQVSGDVDLIARIDSQSNTSAWTKAGVMLRSSLNGNSPEALAAMTPSGFVFQNRATAGGTSATTGSNYTIFAPRWVRIVRTGDTITGYYASDGATWTKAGNSITLALGSSIYVGLAVTSHSAGVSTTAALSNVSIKNTAASPVPPPQKDSDIGSPAIAGSATYSSGKYTINAGGTDIWNTSDQFHYVYQPLSGDAVVTARVSGIGNSSVWAKAGVMVRETLAANSRYADSVLTPSSGYTFQRRIDAGGVSTSNSGFTGTPPGWVRLVRTGYKFDGYYSTDGTTWTLMGSDTVPMTDPVYVGIAVTSHNASLGTTAVVDNLTITSSGGPNNQPPTVSLTSPTSNASFAAPATISLTANASDPENRMSHVDFYAGSTLLSSSTTSPYSYTWSAVPAGTYSLTAVATDADGGKTTSAAVTVTVTGQSSDTQAPSAPSGLAANVTSTTQINLSWTASTDNVGVAGYRIERCQGSGCTTFAQVGTSTTTSYSLTGLTAATSYSFRVRATDAAGNLSAYSSAATGTTQSVVSTAPKTVSFTASTDHSSTMVTGYRLDVFAAGANVTTATPVATSDLGKPTPDASSTISVDRSTFFTGLATGNYVATVSAYGSGGSNRSTSVTFTR